MCRSIKTLREPYTEDVTEDDVRAAALRAPNAAKYVAGKQIVKTIYAPDKLINIVVR